MASQVFFIPASLADSAKTLAEKTEKAYLQLGIHRKIEQDSFVALKIHFGERGNKGYIQPRWLLSLISSLKKKTSRVFITDTNTLYTGNRSNAVDHIQLACGHGFNHATLGIPVLIADGLIGRDSDEIPVDLPRIKTAKIAAAFLNTDSLLCLSHFTGHMLTGFGAAIKNLGMGCASRAGKLEQHSDVHPRVYAEACDLCKSCFDYCPADAIMEREKRAYIIEEKCIGCGECLVVCPAGAIKLTWDGDTDRVQEKMVEYALSVRNLFGDKIGFINYLIKITKDCDCMTKDAPAVVEDIGILSSLDPVALDKASADLLIQHAGSDILRVHYNVDWSVQLKHGEQIGLGSMDYQLV